MSEIRVIIKRQGEAAFEATVENELRPLQEWVGGYIEAYRLNTRPDILAIVNEEGRLLGLPVNCKLNGETFMGTILLVGVKGEEFADCPISLAAAKTMFPGLRWCRQPETKK